MVQIIQPNPRPKNLSASDYFKNAFAQAINTFAEIKSKESEYERELGLIDAREEAKARAKMKLMNSDTSKQDKLERNRQVLRDMENKWNLTEGSLDSYIDQPSLAGTVHRPPKTNKPSLTGESVPEEISTRINRVLQENPEAHADELRLAMDQAGIPPVYSNPYTENRRRQDERSEATKGKKVDLALKRDDEVLRNADVIRDTLPSEEAALHSMRDAIISGDQSSMSLNNLAERTGNEFFRDAAGGQFKTASKTFLINNVSKFGARPNQYIEQQMADSLAKVGRSRSANLVTVQALQFESDIKRRYQETVDKIEDEGNYKEGSLGKTASKEMKNYVEKRQKQLEEKVKFIKNHEKEIDETPKDHIPMIDPDGKLVYIPQEQYSDALLHGAIEI